MLHFASAVLCSWGCECLPPALEKHAYKQSLEGGKAIIYLANNWRPLISHMRIPQSTLHHLCLGIPFFLVSCGRWLAFECSAFFALNIRQRTFECTIRMLLAKGPRTWGSGVSTQVAGCACCWHIWKNFSYHTGKYMLPFFFFFFLLQFSSAISTHLQNPLEKSGSLFSLYAGLHNGWQSVPAVCCCISSTGRGLGVGSETFNPAAPTGVNTAGLCRISFQSPLKSKSNAPKLGNARVEVTGLTSNVGPEFICGVILFQIVRLHTAFPL